jgi:hypothetical protein
MKSAIRYCPHPPFNHYVLPCLLLIIILFCVPNCKKQAPPPPWELPPITEEGKNTIGFMVDGEIWLPALECTGGLGPCGKLGVDIFPSNNNSLFPLKIDLLAFRQPKSGSSSSFYISWADDNNGIWLAGEKLDSLYFEYNKAGDFIPCRRYPDTKADGSYFRITKLDSEKRIFSAVFDLWLYKRVNDKKDSVHLSNGRLDTKFRVCECDH